MRGVVLLTACIHVGSLSGPQLLAESDDMRARGLRQGDSRLIACAAKVAQKADGRVFAPDGGPAFSPAPNRGAVHPAQHEGMPIAPDLPWRAQATFRGREWAYAYARTDAGSPIEFEVSGPHETIACRRRGNAGRAICQWRPGRTQAYTLEVHLLARRADHLNVFVN